MEKIVIKPSSKEIVLRGKPEDGHADVFSYNYEGSSDNSLGSLFIVGHVQPATEDTSYMVNLVASLAKREYYSKTDVAPKDAFSKTLKKINEVLQDFFHNKDLRVNIGLFAIAGENIFISRLGKFKIILGRDNQDIDILNNINLFTKEHIQEKEFSNIISGKVMPQDKIFAFYPARSIVSREKNIKNLLLKLTASDFADELGTIKKSSDAFLCAGIHITISKHKEMAVIKDPQPRELREPEPSFQKSQNLNQPITVNAPKISAKKTSPADAQTQEEIVSPSLALKTETPAEQPKKNNAYAPENSSPDPSTFIHSAEFSSAKKENFISLILKKYKPGGTYMIGRQSISKRKIILTGSAIIGLVLVVIVAKLTFMPFLPIPGIDSESDKAMSALLNQAETNLKSAQSYTEQGNLYEARRLLLESLSALGKSGISDSKDIDETRLEILSNLDQIDKAVSSPPSLLYQISQESGNGSLLASPDKDNILTYATSPDQADSGNLVQSGESSVENTIKVSGFSPLYLMGGKNMIVMINALADKIGSVAINGGDLKTTPLALSGSAINFYPYQDNLYILTSDGIYKILDAANGKSNPVSWLNKDVFLPAQPLLVAVDGNVYVITKNGTLVTYYKGDKKSEYNTSLSINTDSTLLTTTDSPSLYIVDKEFGRIYVVAKESGSLSKTLKLDSDQSLVSASISETGTIYLLTADNKVWKVTP
ncbi:MAG: hypothetical protein HYT62_03020 [Candidatus Yanofskybacteria bacterium]|nr:hypothetical protein [Candidatus Yanofskybacteria bacterium]